MRVRVRVDVRLCGEEGVRNDGDVRGEGDVCFREALRGGQSACCAEGSTILVAPVSVSSNISAIEW